MTLPRNEFFQKKILEKHLPMLEWQYPRSNVVCQLVRRAERFKLMCRMPIFQGMGDSSKKCVNPKEDTGKATANVGMVASKIKRCMPNDSSCREIQVDVPHAYLSRNGRLFQESGSSKRRYWKSICQCWNGKQIGSNQFISVFNHAYLSFCFIMHLPA